MFVWVDQGFVNNRRYPDDWPTISKTYGMIKTGKVFKDQGHMRLTHNLPPRGSKAAWDQISMSV